MKTPVRHVMVPVRFMISESPIATIA